MGWRGWRRVGGTRRKLVGRAVLSGVTMAGGVAGLVMAITEDGRRSDYVYSALLLFVGWRFLRMGLYTSPWGVRICNPVLTWWYPWSRIDHFELAPTGELFAPKAEGIALVTRAGKRRLAWGLTTSGVLIRLSPDDQEVLLAELNDLAEARAVASSRA